MTPNGANEAVCGRSKLRHKAEVLIASLLTAENHTQAAKQAGISEATLARWLRRPAFIRLYRAARRRIVEAAIGQLQQLTAEAVATLKRNLTCGRPSVEVRTADVILSRAQAGVQLLDLQERIEKLEKQVTPQDEAIVPQFG